HGVPIAPRTGLYSLRGKEKAVLAAASDGVPARQIARAHGVSVDNVLRLMRREGVPVQPRARPRRFLVSQRRRVVDLYGEGLTIGQVAERMGCSWGTVSRVLHEEGVHVRLR